MHKYKNALLTIPSICLLLLAGCWDEDAIEERGFVIGAAIDMVDKEARPPVLMLTNQFVIPAGVGAPTQGSGEQEAYTNLSASGTSMYAMDQKMAGLTNKIPFFEHMKVIVVSEEVASTPHLFANIMDVFLRDQEMRRGIKVLISKGAAKDVLDISPEDERLPAIFLDTLLENSFKNTGVFKPIRVGDIHEFLIMQNSFTIPKIKVEGKRITYEGGAVFQGHEHTLAGLLNEEDMLALNLITGENQGGTIEFELEDQIITYRINHAKSHMTIDTTDTEHLGISIDVKVEGEIGEVFGTKGRNMEPKTLETLEEKTAEKIEEISKKAIKKVKGELSADVIGVDIALQQRHPDTWDKVKDNWDHGKNYFANSSIKVSSDVEIHSQGASEIYQYQGK